MEKIKQIFVSGVELLKSFLGRVKSAVIHVSLDVVVGVMGVVVGVPIVLVSGTICSVKSYMTEGLRGVIREVKNMVVGVISLMVGGTPTMIGCLGVITSVECLIMGSPRPEISRLVRHMIRDAINSVVGIIMLPLVVVVDYFCPQPQQ